jgi:hypothetical protein
MFGIPTWGLGLAALSLAAGAYFMGDSAGANRVIARDAKAARSITAKAQKIQAQADQVQDGLAAIEGQRRDIVREIYREVPKIIDRPVYRNICVDADGLRLIDRATDAANGRGGPRPVAEPADGAAR